MINDKANMNNVRVNLYNSLNADILLSNDTLTKHDIDIINTKRVIRISKASEDIKVSLRYKKASGTPIVIYITCIALKSYLKRSTIKAYKSVKFVD